MRQQPSIVQTLLAAQHTGTLKGSRGWRAYERHRCAELHELSAHHRLRPSNSKHTRHTHPTRPARAKQLLRAAAVTTTTTTTRMY
jgi:hypothetical protein